ALTAEPPFARWSGGPAALAHVEAPPPSPLDLRPDLPRELGDVVRRAMAKDPRERYPSAGDLGEAALVAAGGLRRARPSSVARRERFSLVWVHVQPGQSSVPGGADMHDLERNGEATVFGAAPETDGDHHLVPGVDELLRHYPECFERFRLQRYESHHPLVPVHL